jgi:4-diphosphocytidyl-2-C-methyl-D-erythritol kinase
MLFQRAFAKINLGLRVLGKRPDGFHDIETIFFRVDVKDEISVEDAPEITLECDRQDLSSGENLVCSAAKMLRMEAGVGRGAKITLRKRIPVGAGLGGGSADAAATLRLLCRLWAISPSEEKLGEIALKLGSDVPYFLRSGTAHATSRGEHLDYFQLSLPYHIVILSPDLEIPTREAYEGVVPNAHEGSDDLRTLLGQHLELPDLLGNVLKNDLEKPVFRLYPQLRTLKKEFLETGAFFCSMSGSGSSLFAFFPTRPLARSAIERFTGRGKLFYTPPGFQPKLDIEDRAVV